VEINEPNSWRRFKQQSETRIDKVLTRNKKPKHIDIRAGLSGGATGAVAPGPPLRGGPRDDIYLFDIKYSLEKSS